MAGAGEAVGDSLLSTSGHHTTGEMMNLKRSIGLFTGCSIIVGVIIGSGIFVSPQGVLLGAGSYGLSLIIWAVCGIMSLLGALTYAEMGTLIPKSGSAYYYIMEVYGDCTAFIYMFAQCFFILPSGLAIVALTCSEYITALFITDICDSAAEVRQLLAVVLLLLMAFLNTRTVDVSGRVTVCFTLAKVAALTVIIVGGIIVIGKGNTENLHPNNSFKGTSTSVASLSEAFLSGMWAYSGWEGLNFVTEEIKRPERNLPLSIVISIPTVTIVYLLTNMSYFTVMTFYEITTSASAAVTWASHVIPDVFWFIPLSVTVSTFGAAFGSLFINSRLIFVAARENHLLDILAMLHVKHLTPVPAVIVLTVLSVLYVYMGTIVELIQYTGVVVWAFHGMVGIGLLVLRIKQPQLSRPYKAPLLCPVLLIAFSAVLSFAPIVGHPQWGYLFAVSILVLGAILWLMFVKFSLKAPGTGKVTRVLQLLSQVIKTENVQNHRKEDSNTKHNTNTYGSTDL